MGYIDLCASSHPPLDVVRDTVWPGLPDSCSYGDRALLWKILLNYLPAEAAARETGTLASLRPATPLRSTAEQKKRLLQIRRRKSFSLLFRSNDQKYAAPLNALIKDDEELTQLKLLNEDEGGSSPAAAQLCDVQQLRQIQTDLARTKPDDFTRLFSDKKVQFVLTRVLYTWAIRNPGAGYVQGLNDILVPFFIVFLLGSVDNPEFVRNFPETIATRTLLDAEADSSAGFQALVSEIQDFYTSSQPGITIQLERLKTMIKRIRPDILRHFDAEAVDISHFAFRWFNCLLTREFRTACVLQLWDTLLAEGLTQIKAFLQYLCTAYLLALAEPLVHKNFQDVGRQLQCLLHVVPPGNHVPAITALPTVEPGSTQNPCCTSVSKQAYAGVDAALNKSFIRSGTY